jgi:hypothetical protein
VSYFTVDVSSKNEPERIWKEETKAQFAAETFESCMGPLNMAANFTADT